MVEQRSQSAEFPIPELLSPAAYPALADQPKSTSDIQLIETHISWIFLVGPFAYKVKKPIKTPFLDYRSLNDRLRYCNEELRINRQFAPELYTGVVPIMRQADKVVVEGEGAGEVFEYAVKMHRFASGNLLIDWLEQGRVTPRDMEQLATCVATFHAQARVVAPSERRIESSILDHAIENLSELQPLLTGETAALLRSLQIWTRDLYEELEPLQHRRFEEGFVRECHGDLHAGNIVRWQEGFTPFDGIEFNESFRCIDVLSDLAFLSMDLLARGHNPLRHALLNAYVEATADRSALALHRWYEVYRAMVRAKVAHLRWQQLTAEHSEDTNASQTALEDCWAHIRLAHLMAEQPSPTLTITHGPSGSGKSTGSLQFVLQRGAIRLRADVERKRMFGLQPLERPSADVSHEMYSPEATAKTYALLLSLAESILSAGYSVIVDATFLKLNQRRAARELASRLGVEFNILNCNATDDVLRQRVHDRQSVGHDASDADPAVLEQQLLSREPLTDDERLISIQLTGL